MMWLPSVLFVTALAILDSGSSQNLTQTEAPKLAITIPVQNETVNANATTPMPVSTIPTTTMLPTTTSTTTTSTTTTTVKPEINVINITRATVMPELNGTFTHMQPSANTIAKNITTTQASISMSITSTPLPASIVTATPGQPVPAITSTPIPVVVTTMNPIPVLGIITTTTAKPVPAPPPIPTTVVNAMTTQAPLTIVNNPIAPPLPVTTTKSTPAPVTTTKPTPAPVTTAKPTPAPIITAKPTPVPIITAKPTPAPIITAKPTAASIVTAKPTPAPISTAKPTAASIVTAKPTPASIVTAKPASAPIVTAKPTPVPVITAIPTSVPLTTPKPAPAPAPVITAKPIPSGTPAPTPVVMTTVPSVMNITTAKPSPAPVTTTATPKSPETHAETPKPPIITIMNTTTVTPPKEISTKQSAAQLPMEITTKKPAAADPHESTTNNTTKAPPKDTPITTPSKDNLNTSTAPPPKDTINGTTPVPLKDTINATTPTPPKGTINVTTAKPPKDTMNATTGLPPIGNMNATTAAPPKTNGTIEAPPTDINMNATTPTPATENSTESTSKSITDNVISEVISGNVSTNITSTTIWPPFLYPRRIYPKRIEPDLVRISNLERAHVCSSDLPSIRRIEPPNHKGDVQPPSNINQHFLPESFQVGNTTYMPYKILVSSIGARGDWGQEFKCEAPAFIDEIQYILGNDQVQSLRFQCTNPKNKRSTYLPHEPDLPDNSTIRLNLRCSHWGLNEVIGIHFVYDETKGFINVARYCRGSGNRTWATGISTKGWSRWQKRGLVCPENSRIWNGRIKSGQIDGIKFITGVMLGCYIPTPDIEHYALVQSSNTPDTTGNWTEWEYCGNGSFAASVKLYYSNYVKYHNATNETTSSKKIYKYLSEINLGCLFPGKLNTTNFIGKNLYLEGTTAINGVWTNEEKCGGLLRTFNLQMRKSEILEKVGNENETETEIFDKIGAVGFYGGCSNGSWVGHVLQTDVAEWVNGTGQCEPGFAICGIRYLYESDTENATKLGILSVELKCCPIRFSQPCNPTEHWIQMKTLQNNTGIVAKFQYDTKWENATDFPSLYNFLEFRFRTHLWNNSDSADAWKIEPFSTFTTKGTIYKQHYRPEQNTSTIIYQLTGTCGVSDLEYIRVKSRRLKFVNFADDGTYLYTDYN